MKKKSYLLASAFLLLAFGGIACSKKSETVDPVVDNKITEVPTITQAAVNEPTKPTEPVKEEEPTVTPLPTFEPSKPDEVDRSEAFRILEDMNVGWNLGNTLDAINESNPRMAETAWGNPETTKEMIDAIHDQGFNTIRIPITWSGHVGEAPEYKIDSVWMDRVQEIVDYGMDNEMYVIIDTHHEPNTWLVPTMENYDKVQEQLCAIWQQIAERFADYNEKLIFEGMNEPRVKGSSQEWSGGTQDNRKAINRLNVDFIRTVRNAGGNNDKRICIITTNGGSVTENTIKELYLPNDPYMMVAVHLYTPYFFTFDVPDQGYTNWDGSQKGDIEYMMRLLDNHLISKGVPVIITEFGAVNKTMIVDGQETTNESDVLAWLKDYMTETNKYGIKCIWWDNGNYSEDGERFGIFDRRNLTWFSQNIADALIENATQE